MALVALDPIEHYGIQSPETEFYIGDIRLTQLYSQCRHFKEPIPQTLFCTFLQQADQQPFVQIIQSAIRWSVCSKCRSTPFPPAATD